MAEHLSKAAMQGSLWFALFALFTAASFASAENMPDPTRPPASLGVVQEGNAAAPVSSGPVLQSVLISPWRRIAIISGQTVAVGDKFGEARIVKISEGEVVLRNGNELQTLKLYPEIEKRNTPSRDPAKADNRRQ